MYTLVLLLVCLNMASKQGLIIILGCIFQILLVLRHRITRHILIIDKVGGSRDVERSSLGTRHADDSSGTITCHLTIALHFKHTLCLQLSVNALMTHTLNRGNDTTQILLVGGIEGAGMLNHETHVLFRLQTHDNHPVRYRSESRSRAVVEALTIFHLERHLGECRLQIQLTSIVRHIALRETHVRDFQTAQGKVLHAMRTFDEITIDNTLGL